MHGNEVALRHEAAVRRWFSARLPPEDAEDLTQDAMVAIIQGWGRFDGRASERTWVYAICRNTFYNSLRRRHTILPLEEHQASSPDRHVPEVLLKVAVETLPVRLQVLYRLRYDEGLQVSDIASQLGRSEGTVKYQFYEIRRRLARLLR